MWYWILAAYVVIGLLSYVFVIGKWDKPIGEKIWYSVFWIALIPLWILHKVYNNLKKEDNG